MREREVGSLQATVKLPSSLAVVYVRDTYQERRELLYPGLGDPRVVNQVYRGVAPEDMGLDKDGKPLPMAGIRVKTNIEGVRSPS